MKRTKWLVTSAVLGVLAFAYTQGLVTNVKADGCYRDSMVQCPSSTTCGCPATINLNPWGIGTMGVLSTVWYPWVSTAGAPSTGYEDWQSGGNQPMYCQYQYWDNNSQTYQIVNLQNSSTHTCNF